MLEQKSKSNFKVIYMKVITSIISLVISGGISIILPIIGLSSWVFMMMFIIFSAIDNFDIRKIKNTIVGTFVGISLGFGLDFLTMLFSSFGSSAHMIALVIFLMVIVISLVLMSLGELKIAINLSTWIFLIIMAMVPGASDIKHIIPYYGSCILLSLLLIIYALIKKKLNASGAKAT